MPQMFTVKIFKAWGGRTSDNLWSNSYTFSTDSTIEDPEWVTLLEAIATREKSGHLVPVNFMRAVISTYNREAEYDPKQLRVFELAGVGSRAVPSGEIAMPLDIALKLKKNVGYGRSGTLFMRGCLTSADVQTGAGGIITLNAGLDAGYIDVWAQGVQSWSTALTALSAQYVMPPAQYPDASETLDVRIISSHSVSGVSINKRNHRYFDRAAPAGGSGPGA